MFRGGLIDQAEPLRVIERQVITRRSLPRSAKARFTKKRSRRSMGASEQARLCRFAVDFVLAISPLKFSLSTEPKIDITTGGKFGERRRAELIPCLPSIRASRYAGQQAGLYAPRKQLVDRSFIQHVAEMVRSHVRIGHRAMSGQANLVHEARRLPLIPKHLI